VKKIMFGATALVLALAATGGARAQQRGPALAPQAGTKAESQGVSVISNGKAPDNRGPAVCYHEWQGVSVIRDGKALPAADAKAARATTEATADGCNFTLELGGRMVMKGTYKVNKSTTPMQVDMVTSAGAGKGLGVQLKGIYEVKGDTLKICYAPAGQPRPTAFTSEPGSGNQLFVMKRVK
jgi:uncharacterized protein (TIGR03067 family)